MIGAIILIVVGYFAYKYFFGNRSGRSDSYQSSGSGSGVRQASVYEIEEMRNEVFSNLYSAARSMHPTLVEHIHRWDGQMGSSWLRTAKKKKYNNAVYIGGVYGDFNNPYNEGILIFDNGEVHMGMWKSGDLDCGAAIISFVSGTIKIANYNKGTELKNEKRYLYYPNGERQLFINGVEV